MSTTRTDFGVILEMLVGSTKVFEFTIIDPATGTAKNLSDTAVFATGEVKIVKPDNTVIVTVVITYTDRPNGVVEFTISSATAINANAGNWIGELELSNNVPLVIEQQFFNFNILESF